MPNSTPPLEGDTRYQDPDSKANAPISAACYECGKHGHIAVDLPLCISDAQVNTQSTREPRNMTVTSLETHQIYQNTIIQMKQFSLSAALQANQIIIDSTQISLNQSSSRRTANFLGFTTVFKMCQDGFLLDNYGLTVNPRKQAVLLDEDWFREICVESIIIWVAWREAVRENCFI